MELNKVLYISQEIAPYLPDSPMAVTCSSVPQSIQEHGIEVRTFMPKYGFINERRNQLHEVIRLSGMNLIIDDTDHPLIIKVATLQPSRMQVYFIFNEDYFNRTITKDLEIDSSPADNDERSIFFVRGTLETVKKLRWVPQVIHCSGWVSALAPLYIKDFYRDDPSFSGTKVVFSLFDDEPKRPFDKRLYDKLISDGVRDMHINQIKDKEVGIVELTELAIKNSNGIIQCSENIRPEIMEIVKNSKLPFLPYQPDQDNAEAYVNFYKSL
ncbi:MAG: glycogen/starch synthase [Muribaculaceae bacterium]|nr:glycogen/starch synthase [Muribaculaceae bacterium]